MLDVLLYTNQPVVALGLKSAFGESEIHLAGVCTSVEMLIDVLAGEHYGVVLIDSTAEINAGSLADIRDAAGDTPMVIWVDTIATEFVAMVMGLGVRGVLRKSLSPDLQLRCLLKVAEGELWVETELVARLLSTKRMAFTPRELQLVHLLAQGLKNKEIAYRLGLTEGTVKVYFTRLFEKVGVTDRFEMALYAIEHLFGGRCLAPEPETPVVPADAPGRIPAGCLPPHAGMAAQRRLVL